MNFCSDDDLVLYSFQSRHIGFIRAIIIVPALPHLIHGRGRSATIGRPTEKREVHPGNSDFISSVIILACAPATRTWSSRKGISITVSHARPMFYVEVKLLHLLQPSSLLSDRIRRMPQPGQRGVVSAYFEMTPEQILFEEFQEMHYCQEFFTSDAIASLPTIQRSAGVRNNSLNSILALRQDGTDRKV